MATTKKRDAIKEFNFTWEGKDKTGKQVKGEMRAGGDAQGSAGAQQSGNGQHFFHGYSFR